MSTKHVETAADLVRYRCSLKVECTGCGAAKMMNGVDVVRRCGAADLYAIRRRLKCARCGMKAAQLVVLPPF
jgi:hypothetical protein